MASQLAVADAASPDAPQTPRMTRVVVLPIFNSPLFDGSTLHSWATMSGCVHAPLITAAPETITAGKLRDLTARQGAALVAYTRGPSMLPQRTVFG